VQDITPLIDGSKELGEEICASAANLMKPYGIQVITHPSAAL